MKMNFTYLLALFLCGTLLTCQPPVVFAEPQPSGSEALSIIPEKYRGIYWCEMDSVTLFIDDRALIKRKEILVRLTQEEIDMDPELELQEGRLYVHPWEQSFPIQQKGDTTITTIILRDTIFAIGRKQLLKPFKGHLILNTKQNGNTWEVIIASFKDNEMLSLARADLPENLSQLEAITPVETLMKNDSAQTQIIITPTKEEFEKIIDQGVLFDRYCQEFERIIPLRIDSY